MPTSVLRRYTPPTCTLEVAANRSALSRWADQTVLRDVQFQLFFADPKEPTQDLARLEGDRTQLEGLSEAVQTYVQGLLELGGEPQDPMLQRLLPNLPPLSGAGATLPGHEVANGTAISAASSRPTGAKVLTFPRSENFSNETGIYLEPKGLLAHDLHLGTLANETVGASLRLSAVQLFDLADALEDYAAEILSLPSQAQSANRVGRWAGIAAMLVLALGATGGIAKFVMDLGASPASTVALEDSAESTAAAPPDFGLGRTTPERIATPAAPPPAQGDALPAPGSVQPGGAFPFPSGTLFGPGQATPQPAPPPAGDQFAGIPRQSIPRDASQGAPQVPNPPVVQGGGNSSLSMTQAPDFPDPIGTGARSLNEAVNGTDPGIAAATAPSTHRNLGMPEPGDLSQQLAEIQDYFQGNWEPPDDLVDTLEYRVLIDQDGRVQQIVPMGDAAAVSLDRTGMPLLGETFVSPLQPYQQALVRVVLAPDGRVQAFLEGRN